MYFTSNRSRALICLDFLVSGKLYGVANMQCLLSLNLLLYCDIKHILPEVQEPCCLCHIDYHLLPRQASLELIHEGIRSNFL